jgi:asparagine synthase (glutamine-hydrolysing)
MCGIAGIVAPGGFEPSALVEMTHLIRYRGPDGFGFAFTRFGDSDSNSSEPHRVEVIHNQDRLPQTSQPQLGLGNRRLAILDVSTAGSQPMQTDDGSCTLTFNGEIYNFKEIRAELEQAGCRFRTHTDTEVILHAYQYWGTDCVNHFNGMWAFALWDSRREQLFCARDRFGVKPFYYASYGGTFFFASEIKQILQASAMPRTANARTCFLFLEWGLLDSSSETFFENIFQLPPAHTLTLQPTRSLTPGIHRYWQLQPTPQSDTDDSRAVAEFRELFADAIKLRLRSDVPVGVALSGGLDSSSVLCKAREVSPSSQFQTFSACFNEPELDEREYIAEAIGSAHESGHSTFPNEKPFWQNLDTILFHHDEPVGSPAAFPQWCVMAEARKHSVPVILGGQGGDEALCGYQKYQFFYLWHLLRTADPRVFREFLLWRRHGTISTLGLRGASRYLPRPFHAPFSLSTRVGTNDLRESSHSASSNLGSARTIEERQIVDLTFSSIPALLHHEDRASMAHSIESRLPFLDYRLVQFSLRCRPSLKIRDGRTKWILRQALADTLPEKIRRRRTKLGFNTPETRWMHYGLQNGHKEMWANPKLKMARLIQPAKFKTECQRFVQQASGALSADILFRAISLESWAQVFSVS